MAELHRTHTHAQKKKPQNHDKNQNDLSGYIFMCIVTELLGLCVGLGFFWSIESVLNLSWI